MWWKLFACFEMFVTYHNITTPLNQNYTWLDWLYVGIGAGACLLVFCYAFDKRFYHTRAARSFLYIFVAYLVVTKFISFNFMVALPQVKFRCGRPSRHFSFCLSPMSLRSWQSGVTATAEHSA